MSIHYFSPNTDEPLRDADTREVEVRARGLDLSFLTSDGVFSATNLDVGTEQLLAKAPALPTAGTFLDLGCGWGAVASLMAIEAPDASVWAVDVNERALALTKRNATRFGLKNVDVREAGAALRFARDHRVRFDIIWSNPPVRIGKAAMREMLLAWLELLADDGAAYLVVNRHLGADSLATWLNDQGMKASRLASRKGFRILEVRRA